MGRRETRLMDFFARSDGAAHISDVNAAGSFFAMGMFIALGMALRRDRQSVAWIAIGVPPGGRCG